MCSFQVKKAAVWTVDAERGQEALEHFFETGTMPSFLEWHDDSAG